MESHLRRARFTASFLGVRVRLGSNVRETRAPRRRIVRVSAARLAVVIRERQPCVVLTGAGISTESGIPDFRSPTGIWAEVDPFEVASIQAFRRDPERVWSFYRQRIDMLLEAEPNAGHRALAELDVRPAPLCTQCGEVLKPGVTLFGELLPAGAMERATELARSAELMLVVGSSLEVWPVAGLPLEARSLAIVNRGPTALDDRALVKIDAPAGETPAAVGALLSEARGR